VQVLGKNNNQLAESPVWDKNRNTLYWVDIHGNSVHALNVITHQEQSWPMPNKPGCIVLTQEGQLIIGLYHNIMQLNPDSGELSLMQRCLDNNASIRFNDGKCDRIGRFWIGSSHIPETEPRGGLYCLNKGIFTQQDDGFTVANGIGWSPDNTRMYFIDSPMRTIFQYDYDLATGKISNRFVLVQTPIDAGYPDGLTVDKAGCLWVAHWDGWSIRRYCPKGLLLETIDMPVQRPTSCCFGGENLSTLYITSASHNLSTEDLAKGPNAGHLFAYPTETTGILEVAYQS